jgi:hypothetical protein
MHPRHRLLAFLLFNLLWAITLFSFVYRSNSSKPVSFDGITISEAERLESRPAAPWDAPAQPAVKPLPAKRTFTWRDVESEEYAGYLLRLREAGCPEPKVRQIAVSDINERASTQRRKIAVANDPMWWRADALITTLPVFPDANQAVEQERGALLEKLLGPQGAESDRTPPLQAGGVLLTGLVLGSLTPEKHNAVQEIVAAASARQRDYLTACENESRVPNPVEIARQHEQMRGDLGQILSPLELEEFLIRYSPGARHLRQDLRAFEPTPAEFRNLFQALDPIDRQMQLDYGDASALSVKQRLDYEDRCDRAIRRELSPKRFENYRRAGTRLSDRRR